MTERTPVRRELAKQTALLFFVFALLFTLLGAGVYSMVSSSIYKTSDETLLSFKTDVGLITADVPASVVDSASVADSVDEANASLSLQQSIVDSDPQFITLMRTEQGDVLDTVGLYANYPSFLEGVSFDASDVNRIYQTTAGGHAYRAITYPVHDGNEVAYLQVLANVDSELAILDSFTRVLVAYLAAAVIVSATASYLLSRRTLKPIVENWRAQTEFVQNASHELRTPLSVIQTTGELLLDCPDSRIIDRFEDVSIIASETKRLSRLVDDLMALSLDDAGRTALVLSAVDVDALVRDTVATYEDFASLQGKRLAAETSFGGIVEADADKLRQLLGIVLDNALKYTAAGDEIVVTTRTAGSKCVVEIADTGCGIEPEDRERVFQRFYRADKARSRETGGHGLGLSLARRIVEAHGGTIALSAGEPRGTVATIALPR